jgi:peptidoglycan/LPS O-acetylase OafA/YrhL
MQGWVMLVFLVVLIASAALSYHYFERPVQVLLRGRRRHLAVTAE